MMWLCNAQMKAVRRNLWQDIYIRNKGKPNRHKLLIMSHRILRNEALNTHALADPGIQLAEMREWSSQGYYFFV
jgi:hypothetical protein